ncbi:hypothetical protein EYF80_040144 [Liparis tanakae]|uniref:Uncharacterized protein n=1 Tax=Liparis tanakae TaxID=230148 RepID=A0A4Z2G7T8_9TELE|nr:hypothetical protein EYF80_040144 [Liparis tanakae]
MPFTAPCASIHKRIIVSIVNRSSCRKEAQEEEEEEEEEEEDGDGGDRRRSGKTKRTRKGKVEHLLSIIPMAYFL